MTDGGFGKKALAAWGKLRAGSAKEIASQLAGARKALESALDGEAPPPPASASAAAPSTSAPPGPSAGPSPADGGRAAEIAENEPRAQGYAGDDASLLLELARAEFLTYFPEQRILGGVIESASWIRNRSEVWNPSTQTAEVRDRSHVIAYVFADEPDELVSQWPVSLTKDHGQGDRLSAHLEVKLRQEPLPVVRLFPRAKLPAQE